MTFTTLTYVLFLPMVFALYWGLKEPRRQNVFLVLASYFFYGWWDWRFCGLMLFSSLVDFVAGRNLFRARQAGSRRGWLLVSLVCNLGLLGFFKYFNFFAENAVALASSLGLALDPFTVHVVLPVGISFYTFQTMSYTIDIYRGQLEPTDNLVDFLAFVAFFPQLVAGPIERATNLIPQFTQPRAFELEEAREGCRQILWGFFKKLAVADQLAPIVDLVYASPERVSGPTLIFATVCFAFQIYGDFSGYSDIAIGTARLLGFRLMRNFAYPYFSQSLDEFWRRWHISLSTWFRDYVFIPLGGSRVSSGRKLANILITFLVSGLWHGASWNFVVWGGLNGLGILPGSATRRDRHGPPGGEGWLPTPAAARRMLTTFALICLTWVFFRARTLGQAVNIVTTILLQLFDLARWKATALVIASSGSEMLLPIALTLAMVGLEWAHRERENPLGFPTWPRAARWFFYSMLLWLTLSVTRQTGPFIYFQF
ncbi:MAG: MBOAT family protein [Vulcanimicrobiota bacterium]